MKLHNQINISLTKIKKRHPMAKDWEFSTSTDWFGFTITHIESKDSERVLYLGAIFWSMWG